MRMMEIPVFASPDIKARWMGAAPRQRGKSDILYPLKLFHGYH